MTGRVETADGKVYELPALLEWRLRRTGGVPCDSFRVKCLYSAEMGEVLKAACRFAATENGVTRFRGVIDEWSAVCGAEGAVLTVEGRGMAALLLDNEAEAVTYQRAALSEILKDHAAVCGVAWEPRGEVYGTGEYAVASGSSRWKAVEGFARRCGLTPYFTREGVLCLRSAAGTAGARYHPVVQGDTRWAIAARNGTTVRALCALNPQIANPNRIYPGERVRLS